MCVCVCLCVCVTVCVCIWVCLCMQACVPTLTYVCVLIAFANIRTCVVCECLCVSACDVFFMACFNPCPPQSKSLCLLRRQLLQAVDKKV